MAIDISTGIGFGLGAAACQSLSYLFSRRFVGKTGGSPALLLIASHLIMGAGSLALLPFLAPRHLPPFGAYALPLAGCAVFYLVAQLGLFHVLRQVESSRVAPLLGLKVIVLAVLAVLFTREGLGPLQWVAVGLSAAAAWLLNEAGGRLPVRCLGMLGVSIVCYCLSDLNITALVKRLEGVEPSPAVTGAAFSYSLCALITLPFAFRRDLLQPKVWLLAAPFAAAWFAAMCLLYACFGLIGVVFGNIVQSTRGIFSVVIGWGLAHIGHTHLESRIPRRVFWRRVTGALLMLAAVALYVLGR